MWLTEDGGATWAHGNEGIVADYLPESTRATAIDLCVHHLERARLRPERLFMQFHGGVYRSDDAGGRGRTSPPACHMTSAFRSCSTPPIPTARS